jgi:hypothetical protein
MNAYFVEEMIENIHKGRNTRRKGMKEQPTL